MAQPALLPDPVSARSVHQLTLPAAAGKRPFEEFEVARCVAEVACRREVWRDGRLLAWVLLPDRWLGLVEPGELDSLPAAVARLKSLVRRSLRGTHPDTGRVWASAYEIRALDQHEDVRLCARRLVARPLRDGLVARLGDYAYWDAVWLERR